MWDEDMTDNYAARSAVPGELPRHAKPNMKNQSQVQPSERPGRKYRGRRRKGVESGRDNTGSHHVEKVDAAAGNFGSEATPMLPPISRTMSTAPAVMPAMIGENQGVSTSERSRLYLPRAVVHGAELCCAVGFECDHDGEDASGHERC